MEILLRLVTKGDTDAKACASLLLDSVTAAHSRGRERAQDLSLGCRSHDCPFSLIRVQSTEGETRAVGMGIEVKSELCCHSV